MSKERLLSALNKSKSVESGKNLMMQEQKKSKKILMN